MSSRQDQYTSRASVSKAPKFLPDLWKTEINKAVYDKLPPKFPNLILNWEGEIRHQGDMVWFADPHAGARFQHHGLMADKTIITVHAVDDPVLVQITLPLMKKFIDDISDYVISHFEFPGGPILFAGQSTDIELMKPSGSFTNHLRELFVYGWRSLNPIRVATEIIAKSQRMGLNDIEIIKRLERFF